MYKSKYIVIMVTVTMLVFTSGCKKSVESPIMSGSVSYDQSSHTVSAPGYVIYYNQASYQGSARVPDSAIVVIMSPDSEYFFYSPIQGNLDSLSAYTSVQAIWLIMRSYLVSSKKQTDTTSIGLVFKPLSGDSMEVGNLKHRWAGFIYGSSGTYNEKIVKRRELISLDILNILHNEWPVSFNRVPVDTFEYTNGDTAFLYGANILNVIFSALHGAFFYSSYADSIMNLMRSNNTYLRTVSKVELAEFLDLVARIFDIFTISGGHIFAHAVEDIGLSILVNITKDGLQNIIGAHVSPEDYGNAVLENVFMSLVEAFLQYFSGGSGVYINGKYYKFKHNINEKNKTNIFCQPTLENVEINNKVAVLVAIFKALQLIRNVAEFTVGFYDELSTSPIGLYAFPYYGENNPPNTPSTIIGPDSGFVDTLYLFGTSTTDPDGDSVKYEFDWGDGSLNTITGYYASGEAVSVWHRWNVPGSYDVKVRAIDIHGAISDWSNPHPITIHSVSHGQWIVFDDNRGNIWKVRPDGSDLEQLTNNQYYDVEPDISRDGGWVVFSRRYSSDSCALVKMSIDGSYQANLLTINYGIISSCAWSPDGSKIVMHIFYPDSGFADIYIVNSDGTGFRQLTSDSLQDEYPSINPADGRIYFVRGEGFSKKIYSMRLDGSDLSMFLDYSTDFGVPKWNPSGTKLIVQTRDYPHHYLIFDFANNDTTVLRTPNGEDSDEASWSPDGSQIVFDVGNDNDVNHLYIYTIADSSYRIIGNFYGNRPTWGGR